ncbi:MAG: S24 family peptidase [Saprospiraceae bacterium]
MSPVTQRFLHCFLRLKDEGRVRSARAFAAALEYLPQSWSEVMNGRRDVTIDLIRRAVEVFEFNPVYIFTGEGEFFMGKQHGGGFRLVSVVSAEKADERIVHVPVAAQAGYAEGLGEVGFVQDLPTFSLPDYRFKLGTHRCFDVAGDSMEPTLFEGDRVVCSFVEPDLWESAIKNSHVYVLVTRADVVVKRVQNRLRDMAELTLLSDNQYYKPYNLSGDELREVWQVRLKISPFLNTPPARQDDLTEQLKLLQDTIRAQSKLIDHLNHTVEKLGKS